MELQMYVYFSEYQIYSGKNCKKSAGFRNPAPRTYAKQLLLLPPVVLRAVIRCYTREEHCRKRTCFFSIQFIYCCYLFTHLFSFFTPNRKRRAALLYSKYNR